MNHKIKQQYPPVSKCDGHFSQASDYNRCYYLKYDWNGSYTLAPKCDRCSPHKRYEHAYYHMTIRDHSLYSLKIYFPGENP